MLFSWKHEDVLDTGADLGARAVVRLLLVGERLVTLTFMHMRRGRLEATDDFVLRVDTDVILIAERVFAALPRPAPIHIFLRPFRPTSVLGRPTRLDPAVLLAVIAGNRHRNDGSINDPCLASKLSAARKSSKRSNTISSNPCSCSRSRKRHTVVASGTASSMPKLRKRASESRSRIRYSTCSSARLWRVC